MVFSRALLAVCLATCGLVLGSASYAGSVPVPVLAEVLAGPFIAGSDAAEREYAYQLDEAAYGHSRTRERGWYDRERPRGTKSLDRFFITRTLITNAQYAAFVDATGHRVPDVDPETWRGYRLIHPYERTRRHAWTEGVPPPGRENHPVVMVSHDDANAYAAWLSAETGRTWRLPTELEWEKAARGTDGRIFPWGDTFDPALLNSHDSGPLRHVAGWQLSSRCKPLRPARPGRHGLRVDYVARQSGALSGQGRIVGRQRLRHLPACGTARPAGGYQAHPRRLPPRRRSGRGGLASSVWQEQARGTIFSWRNGQRTGDRAAEWPRL